MTLVAASTGLNISITLLIIVLVVVSLLMILVVMMQRPKQEGLGAAFGGGMTDQLLGAGTTSFLQKSTVVLGILFFLLSLILGILVGRSNKEQGLSDLTPVPTEEKAAPAPGIADGVDLSSGDGEEDALLEQIEAATRMAEEANEADAAEETASAPAEEAESTEIPAETEAPEPEVVEEPAPAEEVTPSETTEEPSEN
ncbi:preprotein translocase subunit SecG [Roseibacillus persicicus]|uniref:preprotein translocase subunit SecG n=1 Tax=Roseibacillus persicicus TaxID=454148 RepID=UPI00398AD23B